MQLLDITDRERVDLPDEVLETLRQAKSTIDYDATLPASLRADLSAQLGQKIREIQSEQAPSAIRLQTP